MIYTSAALWWSLQRAKHSSHDKAARDSKNFFMMMVDTSTTILHTPHANVMNMLKMNMVYLMGWILPSVTDSVIWYKGKQLNTMGRKVTNKCTRFKPETKCIRFNPETTNAPNLSQNTSKIRLSPKNVVKKLCTFGEMQQCTLVCASEIYSIWHQKNGRTRNH